MSNQLALQWTETGMADNLAFLSRPFDDLASIFNVDEEVNDDETYNAVNIANYRLPASEQGASGRYLATVPANTPPGYREITVHEMAGSTLVESDLLSPAIGYGVVYWDGEDVFPISPTSGGGGVIVAAGVTVLGPVLSAEKIVLVRGDDYLADDERALNFTFTGVPSLVGSDIVFSIAGYISSSPGEALDASTVQIELTRDQTNLLVPRTGKGYSYDVQATLSNGSVVTLARGECFVLADVTR